MAKVVTAPLVIAKAPNGADVYLYRGSALPDGLADGEEKRLADFLGDAEESSEDKPAAKKAASKSKDA